MTNSFSTLEDTTEVVQDKPEQKRLAIENKSVTKTESVRTKIPPVEKSDVGSSTTEEDKIQRGTQDPTSDKPRTSNSSKPSRLPRLSTTNRPGHILKSDEPNINR